MSAEAMTEVVETVEETATELEDEELEPRGWGVPPLLTVRRTKTVGEHDDTLVVEVRDNTWCEKPGDLIELAEGLVDALQDDDRAAGRGGTTVEVRAVEVPEGLLAGLRQFTESRKRVGRDSTEAELQQALAAAEQDGEACREKHASWRKYLRGLILAARDSQSAQQGSPEPATDTAAASEQDGGNS